MPKWMIEKLQKLTKPCPPFDPSSIEDRFAMHTEWEPAESGGVNSWTAQLVERNRKLVEIDPSRMEFRVSEEAKELYFWTMGLGIVFGLFFYFVEFPNGKFLFSINTTRFLLIGLFFFIGGGCLFCFGTIPIVFDKYRGMFWKGWKRPDKVVDRKEIKYFIDLEDIHALQLVTKYFTGRSVFYSYQLNLVLKNKSRINVVDYGSPEKLREDAHALSNFLGKPVWDAT